MDEKLRVDLIEAILDYFEGKKEIQTISAIGIVEDVENKELKEILKEIKEMDMQDSQLVKETLTTLLNKLTS